MFRKLLALEIEAWREAMDILRDRVEEDDVPPREPGRERDWRDALSTLRRPG